MDIHIYMPSDPDFIDAARLVEYVESIGVTQLLFDDMAVDATKERAIERQLIAMVENGMLVQHPRNKHLYRLASGNGSGSNMLTKDSLSNYP